jgi:hypothetical protein
MKPDFVIHMIFEFMQAKPYLDNAGVVSEQNALTQFNRFLATSPGLSKNFS